MYSSPDHARKMRHLAEIRYWKQEADKLEKSAFRWGFFAGCVVTSLVVWLL